MMDGDKHNEILTNNVYYALQWRSEVKTSADNVYPSTIIKHLPYIYIFHFQKLISVYNVREVTLPV